MLSGNPCSPRCLARPPQGPAILLQAVAGLRLPLQAGGSASPSPAHGSCPGQPCSEVSRALPAAPLAAALLRSQRPGGHLPPLLPGARKGSRGYPCGWGGGSTDGPALTCHCPAGPWLRLSSRPSGGLYLPGSCGQGCLQEQNPPPSGLFLGPLQRGLALGTADTSSCPVSPGPGPQGRPSSRTVCDGAAGLPAQEEGDPPGSARVLGNSKTTCPPTWDACAHIPQAAAPRAYLEVRGPPQQPARSRTVSR